MASDHHGQRQISSDPTNRSLPRHARRVSAIIPTLREDAWLLDAIESILRDPTEDLEIVLVGDGHFFSDALRARLRDTKAVLVELPQRRGTPHALNAGIAASTGEFVLRLDADDLSIAGRAGIQMEYLCENPQVVAVGGAVIQIREDGSDHVTVMPAHIGDVRADLLQRNVLVHSTMMFRASALDSLGGYNTDCTRMQDYELYLRLGQLGEVHVLNERLAKYRIHNSQSSRRSPVISRATWAILRERYRLSRFLNVSLARTSFAAIMWLGWQVLRSAGIVRPRHLSKNGLNGGR